MHWPLFWGQYRPGPSAHARTLALVGHLPVVLDARRIGSEKEAVLSVVVGVKDQENRIALHQVEVPDALTFDDGSGIGVVKPESHVEGLVVEEDPKLRGLRGGLAIQGSSLDEAREGIGLVPQAFVEPPVDHGSRINTVCHGLRG